MGRDEEKEEEEEEEASSLSSSTYGMCPSSMGSSHGQRADSDAVFSTASRVHRHRSRTSYFQSIQECSQQRAVRSLTMASVPLETGAISHLGSSQYFYVLLESAGTRSVSVSPEEHKKIGLPGR